MTDEEDFSTLVGEGGNPILPDLTNHPNSFWLHPNLSFLSVSGPQTVKAAEMATMVLLSIQESSLGDFEPLFEDEIAGIYSLLAFFWTVE